MSLQNRRNFEILTLFLVFSGDSISYFHFQAVHCEHIESENELILMFRFITKFQKNCILKLLSMNSEIQI